MGQGDLRRERIYPSAIDRPGPPAISLTSQRSMWQASGRGVSGGGGWVDSNKLRMGKPNPYEKLKLPLIGKEMKRDGTNLEAWR
jgi:hypothetical protein